MAFAFGPSVLLGVASGVAFAAFGAAVLRLKPRTPGSVGFGAFAALWGAALVAGNVGQAATADGAQGPWLLLLVAFIAPLYLPLLFFVSAYPAPRGALVKKPVALAGLAVPALFVLLLIATQPTLFITRAGGPGPLFAFVIAGNSVLAFAVATFIVARKIKRTRGDVPRAQLALVLGAFLVYVAHRSTALVVWVGTAERLVAAKGVVGYAFDVASLSAAFAVAVWAAWTAYRSDLPWRDWLVAAALGPLIVGVTENALRLTVVGGFFTTAGLWRFVMVALLAYAIARYRLLDIDLGLQRVTSLAAYGATAMVVFTIAWNVADGAFATAPGLGLLAAAGAALVAVPALRVSRRAFAHLAPATPEGVVKRKVEAFRAALADDRDAGRAGDDPVRRLRDRLGLSPREAELLARLVDAEGAGAAVAPAYRVERELGRGSFGRALLAMDTALGRPVVLKQSIQPWTLDPTGRERFLSEARIMASVSHPNVVAVYGVDADGAQPAIVMEYVPGGSLADRLAGAGRLPAPDAVALVRDVLLGVQALHARGIVHRDLTPGNVLLAANGAAKVADFGVAEPPAELRDVARAVAPKRAGTIAFMSPEQARGDGVDSRSDLYAVGAMLYAALTGGHYVDLNGLSEDEALEAVQSAAVRLPAAGVPTVLEDVLQRALAKGRDARFADAGAMIAALDAAAPLLPAQAANVGSTFAEA